MTTILDTSAVAAVVLGEPDAEAFLSIMLADIGDLVISAANRVEIGMGRHPAGLDLGDCFAYALARVSGAPLLYKGEDFRQTDILSAF